VSPRRAEARAYSRKTAEGRAHSRKTAEARGYSRKTACVRVSAFYPGGLHCNTANNVTGVAFRIHTAKEACILFGKMHHVFVYDDRTLTQQLLFLGCTRLLYSNHVSRVELQTSTPIGRILRTKVPRWSWETEETKSDMLV